MTEPKTARQILIDWANGQHPWVRRVAGEVINTQQPLSVDAADTAYKEALAQYGLSDATPPEVAKLTLDLGDHFKSGHT